MSSLTRRRVKGSALTNDEVDDNWDALNADKHQDGRSPNYDQVIANTLYVNNGATFIADSGLVHSQNTASVFQVNNSHIGAGAQAMFSVFGDVAVGHLFSTSAAYPNDPALVFRPGSINLQSQSDLGLAASGNVYISGGGLNWTVKITSTGINETNIGATTPGTGEFSVLVAPTKAADDNSTNVATTAWYVGQKAVAVPLINGSAAIGASLKWAASDHVHPTDTTRAPTAGPTFTGTATFNIITATGQIISTLATGTAPLVVASTTQVANLNASFLIGKTWAIPDPIGATTANTIAATTLSASGAVTFSSTLQVSGNIGVKIAPSNSITFYLVENALTTTNQYIFNADLTASSSATVQANGITASISTAAAAFTLPLGIVFHVINGGKGAGSTYTQQEGFRVDNLTSGTTNIGLRLLLAVGANKWNIYADGDAQNYIAGLTGFGVLTPAYPIDVQAATASGIGMRIRARSSDDTATIGFWNNTAATEQARIVSLTGGNLNFSTGSTTAIQAQIINTAGAARFVTLTGSVAGAPILATSAGGLAINVTGVTNVTFSSQAGVNTQFRIRGDNVAINYLDVFGTTAGNGPIIQAEGTDTNIRLNLYSKGNLSVAIATNQGASIVAHFLHIATAVNYLAFTPSAAAGTPSIAVAGTDTNIALTIASKGASGINLQANSATQAFINPQASSVNYLVLSGNTAGNRPYVFIAGSDTNAGLGLITKGTGTIVLQTNTNVTQFEVLHFAVATRWVTVSGSTTNPTISTNGGSLSIGVALVNTTATITYSASMTPDAALGNDFVITATNGTAFTINTPTNPSTGQSIVFTIRNTSGGALGVATWAAVFKMVAWVQPANGFSRSIRFRYDGTNWVELMRGAADVAN